jgi:hypothetical protein
MPAEPPAPRCIYPSKVYALYKPYPYSLTKVFVQVCSATCTLFELHVLQVIRSGIRSCLELSILRIEYSMVRLTASTEPCLLRKSNTSVSRTLCESHAPARLIASALRRNPIYQAIVALLAISCAWSFSSSVSTSESDPASSSSFRRRQQFRTKWPVFPQ